MLVQYNSRLLDSASLPGASDANSVSSRKMSLLRPGAYMFKPALILDLVTSSPGHRSSFGRPGGNLLASDCQNSAARVIILLLVGALTILTSEIAAAVLCFSRVHVGPVVVHRLRPGRCMTADS